MSEFHKYNSNRAQNNNSAIEQSMADNIVIEVRCDCGVPLEDNDVVNCINCQGVIDREEIKEQNESCWRELEGDYYDSDDDYYEDGYSYYDDCEDYYPASACDYCDGSCYDDPITSTYEKDIEEDFDELDTIIIFDAMDEIIEKYKDYENIEAPELKGLMYSDDAEPVS